MFPKINQNIVIDIFSKGHSYRSIVADIIEKEILIGFPLGGDDLALYPNGTKIEVSYIIDGNKYGFQAEIIGRKIEIIPLYRITRPQPNEIKRIQLRENFRVNANLQVIITNHKFYTVNISAGGLLFTVGDELKLYQGEMIAGTLMVPGSNNGNPEPIPFHAEIIRLHKPVDQDRANVAVKFVRIEPRNQSKLLQYCFEKQKQNRFQR